MFAFTATDVSAASYLKTKRITLFCALEINIIITTLIGSMKLVARCLVGRVLGLSCLHDSITNHHGIGTGVHCAKIQQPKKKSNKLRNKMVLLTRAPDRMAVNYCQSRESTFCADTNLLLPLSASHHSSLPWSCRNATALNPGPGYE